jgi:hypothetical protein
MFKSGGMHHNLAWSNLNASTRSLARRKTNGPVAATGGFA